MMFSLGNLQVQVDEKRKTARINRLNNIFSFLIAIIIALIITAVVILVAGKSPIEAFQAMFIGAFGNWSRFSEVLVRSVPYILTGLGLTLAYRTGLVSIGAEGQMIMGGLVATVVALQFDNLPSFLLVPLSIIMGMAAGGIWSGFAGYFKAKRGASEVIITIMLNYIASYLLLFLLDGPLREPPGYYPQSSELAENARLSIIIPGTRMNSGIILALLGAFLVYFLLWKLPLGYQMRAVGYNPIAARTSGISVEKNIVLAMFLSGALSGLAGAVEITGLHYRLINGFSANMGFDAIAIALLGGLHPLGVLISGFLFSVLRVGANTMQRLVQVPASLVNVIQGLIIIMVLSQKFLGRYTIRIFKSGENKPATQKEK